MLKGEGGECKNREGEGVLLQWDVQRGSRGVKWGGCEGLCGSAPEQGCVPLPWSLASPESSFPALSEFLCARGVLLLFLPSAGAGKHRGHAGDNAGGEVGRSFQQEWKTPGAPVRSRMGWSLSLCPAAQPHTAPAGGDVDIPGSWPFLQLCKCRDLLGCETLITGTLEFLLRPSPLPHDVGYSPSMGKCNAPETQPRVLVSVGGSFP